MNPSSSGWILKHTPCIKNVFVQQKLNANTFYSMLLKSGFLYGVSVQTISYGDQEPLAWTAFERAKVNLFDSLFVTYCIKNATDEGFYTAVTAFYNKLNSAHPKYFSYFSKYHADASSLEKIIHGRIQTNEAYLQKNFSNFITNAFLFLDVLCFDKYLENQSEIDQYAAKLESLLMNAIWLALMQKEEKEYYDKLLLKLFEKSLRYTRSIDDKVQQLGDLPLDGFTKMLEKRYLFDLAALAIWDDAKLDKREFHFLKELGRELKLPETVITDSTAFVHQFIETNRGHISFLNYSNPVKHFYNQTTQTVRILILRNKKRLLQELSESKDLVLLLGQSTRRDLSKAEKKRVKSQLLDICKSIPSLALFMLPGGGILLPLLIKFIPELLPSAFNENRIATDEKEEPL